MPRKGPETRQQEGPAAPAAGPGRVDVIDDQADTAGTPSSPSAADPGGERFRITEALLLSAFREKALAALALAVVDRKELVSLATKLGLSPLPGKRLKTMKPPDHALLLARSALEADKPRKALLTALNSRLPAPLLSKEELDGSPDSAPLLHVAEGMEMERRIGVLVSLLGEEERSDAVMDALENGLLKAEERKQPARPKDREFDRLKAQAAKAERRAKEAEESARREKLALEEREKSLKQRIDELQKKNAVADERLGQKNRECNQYVEMVDTLKNDLKIAFRRAARHKHALDETRSASEREARLEEALVKERQRADIEAAKLEILEYQLDILEQDEDPGGETQIIHDNDPVPGRVLKYIEKAGSAPRILVVGGAGKQRAHRERDFTELKERLCIDGEWRFADYTSWHRELPRLRNDIRNRFDLVFVLHWNRTTFVQKMHDEARAAEARVRTVPYRGFLSLEKAVREEVDRFVQENL